MRTSSSYLEQALELGEQEMNALMQGNVDMAADLADKRTWLISQAWNARREADDSAYYLRLLEVQKMQERLTTEARRCRENIRTSLMLSRKEGQRMAGYRNAVAHAV